MTPLVSILVTVFNRRDFISDAIASVLNSSFEDFELIVVDDCSNDDSMIVAQKCAGSDPRVRVISNMSNLGQFRNRQRAAELAKGKYLKYLDSDDVIYPHSLSLMVDALEACPEAALALSHSVVDPGVPYPIRLSPEQAYKQQFLGSGCLSCGPSGAIMRRDAFHNVGGYDHMRGVAADIDLWYRLAARWPTVLIPPALVWWRRHAGQEFSKGDAQVSYLMDGFQLALDALNSEHCPLSSGDRLKALVRCRQHHARRLLSMATRHGQVKQALRLYRNSELSLADLGRGLRGYV